MAMLDSGRTGMPTSDGADASPAQNTRSAVGGLAAAGVCGARRGRGQRWHGLACGGGEEAGVDLGPGHLLAHEVVVEVQDGAGLGGDYRVAAEGELVVLLLLA